MSNCEIIDTFPAFLTYWARAQQAVPDVQLRSWESDYMDRWPELLEKQIQDYSDQNLEWKKVAHERILPHWSAQLPVMCEARKNLRKYFPLIYIKAAGVLNFDEDMVGVIYVGMGCGAGWVTTFQNRLSILFGLENIADSGWSDPDSICGLIAHEMGHWAHYRLRRHNCKPVGAGAWWQLYSEGFAQYCEYLINGSWHQENSDKSRLVWCQTNKGRLAAEFLKSIEENLPINPFFGSWFNIEGHSETGYFLGNEVIRALMNEVQFSEIALLDDYVKRSRKILEKMRRQG